MLFDKRELSSADVLDSDTGGSGRTGRADYYRLETTGCGHTIRHLDISQHSNTT